MDAFQVTAFQNRGFQAGSAGTAEKAFQCGAFQSSAFQTCGGASGYQPAFQCGAFQQGAFQTCVHPAPLAGTGTGGGFVRRPLKRPRFSPVVLSPEQLLAERVRAGVVPAPVRQVVKKVAREALADLEKNDAEIERELRAELARIEIGYERAYARALEQERERLVTAEIRRLLQLQARQREAERLAGIAEELALLKRQIDELRRRDEEALELLLLYS